MEKLNAEQFVDALAQAITRACVSLGIVGSVNGSSESVTTQRAVNKPAIVAPVVESTTQPARRKRETAQPLSVAPVRQQAQQAATMGHEIAFSGKDRPRIGKELFKGFSSIIVYANGQPFELAVNAEGRGRFSWPLLDALEAPHNSVIVLQPTQPGVYIASVNGQRAAQQRTSKRGGGPVAVVDEASTAMAQFSGGGPVAGNGKKPRSAAQLANDAKLAELGRQRAAAKQQAAMAPQATAQTVAPRRGNSRQRRQAEPTGQQQAAMLTRNRASGNVDRSLLASVGVPVGGGYTVPQY